MADVEFVDNRIKVKSTIDKKIRATLEECAAEIESQTKRNTRVDTGQTKNSWQHKTFEREAVIGSNLENAIWEEYGTGEYAINGNGRKGGWTYKSDKDNQFYKTTGKKPSRAFYKAYTALKSKIINRLQNCLKGM